MDTEFARLVDRLIGIMLPIKEMAESGLRSADDLEELTALGSDLRTTAEGLVDELRSGQSVPERWRESSVAPWRGAG